MKLTKLKNRYPFRVLQYVFSVESLGLGLRGFQAVSMFALSVVLARFLGPEEFGVYSYALSWVVFLGLAAQLGLVPTVIREIPSLLLTQDQKSIRYLVGSSNYLVLASFCTIAVGLFFLVRFELVPSIYHATLLGGLPAVFLIAQASLVEAVVRGHNKPIVGQLNQLLFRPGLSLSIVALCIFATPSLLGPQTAMTIQVVAALIGAVVINLLAQLIVKQRFWAFDKIQILNLGRRASWLTLSSILNASAAFVPVVFLGFLSNEYQVGLFVIALQTTVLIVLGSVVASNQYGPLLAAAYARKDFQEMQNLATNACKFSVAVASILFVPLMLFHKQFVIIAFGAEFLDASRSLLLLSFVHLFHALFGVIGVIMMTIREERKMFLFQLIGLAVQALIFTVCIPLYGAFGAALGAAAAAIFFNGTLFYVIFKKTGVVSLPFGLGDLRRR